MLRLRVDGGAVFTRTRKRLPTEPFHTHDSAWQPRREELPHMERNALEQLKAHLMDTHEEFRRLASQHSEFARKLDALEAIPHPSNDEQLEESRLKKLKLHLKDQMEEIVSQYRSQQVA